MNIPSLIRLLVLAAICGGSFLLIRIGVPILGPAILIEYRVGLAALFLLGVSMLVHKRLDVRAH
ncbi:MAG: hypothetical protein A3I66_04425 [Burkholderiales bacterium RIFCSPLOWO2_02_FULL_57_36]|nr:MAG: hypothetical protein A3I66_04425 [Burkholderiales bacterium RIFCSPLOWO2_02_FULL_57_36]